MKQEKNQLPGAVDQSDFHKKEMPRVVVKKIVFCVAWELGWFVLDVGMTGITASKEFGMFSLSVCQNTH